MNDEVVNEAWAKVIAATQVLVDAGLRPTRVLMSVSAYKALSPMMYERDHGRTLIVGDDSVSVTVTSTNPSAIFATAYIESR